MKKLIAIAAIAAISQVSIFASGTLIFQTSDAGTGPFVFDTDGTTKLDNSFSGQIYAGPDANNLTAVGPVGTFGVFNGLINTGVNGMIFNGTEVAVSSVADSATGVYQIRAWQSSAGGSYEAAVTGGGKAGVSDVVTVQFGAQGPPASPGPNVSGFQAFQLVPEPGTITLGLLGLGGLIASRRRKNA
jgi:hypothetical protein